MAGAGGGERGLSARTAVAVVLAVLSGLLGPAGAIASWAWTQASDTDRFVATYAPLARAPQVQQLVVARISNAALKNLGPVGGNDLVRGVVTDTVTTVVASPAFANIWEQTLRTSHQQLRALLADEAGTLEIEDNTLQMPLGPFVEALKQRLIAAGVPFADRLPTVTIAVPLVHLDPQLVALARGSYRGLELAATWVPWLALLCGVISFGVWPNKRRALIGLGSCIAGGAAAVTIVWSLGEPVVVNSFAGDTRPVVALFVETARGPLVSPMLALGVAAAVLLFVGLLSLPSPRRVE